MIKYLTAFIFIFTACHVTAYSKSQNEKFPDGSIIPSWFTDTTQVNINKLG